MKNFLLKKKNDKKKIKSILRIISRHFKIIDENFNSPYAYICWFTLAETPCWKYGIWLCEYGQYYVLGEHIDLIDKFKPSYTYISYKNNLNKFIQNVKGISLNPKLYFVDSLTEGNAIIDYKEIKDNVYIGYQAKCLFNTETSLYDKYYRDVSVTQDEFINEKYNKFIYNKEKEKRENDADRRKVFDFFKNLPNTLNGLLGVAVIDRNKNSKYHFIDRYELIIISKLKDEKLEILYDEVSKSITKASNELSLFSEHHIVLNEDVYYTSLYNLDNKYDYLYLKMNESEEIK